MTIQGNMFDIKEGRIRRDAGIDRAVSHADVIESGWKEMAWELFTVWIERMPVGFKFRIEEFRLWITAGKKLADPPSKRAFGFIAVKAVKSGLVKKAGHATVLNPDAHGCFCSLWEKI